MYVMDLHLLSDLSDRFELALQLKDLRAGYELAKKLEVGVLAVTEGWCE